MKATVFGLDGKSVREISLPSVFDSEPNEALIRRAVLSMQSARKQPKGKYRRSGMDNTARYIGYRGLPNYAKSINVGHARLPRLKNRRGLAYGKVAQVSQSRGGRSAHPPKVETLIHERLNKKEHAKALKSAIAATANKEMVTRRNAKEWGVPMVIVNAFEALSKTSEVAQVLEKLKVFELVTDAKNKRKIRAGKGKRRHGKYKRKKSLLIVTGENAKVYKGARNLEGVDIVEAKNLNVELLAPGSHAGRLTLWTESALQKVEQQWGPKK